MITTDPKILGLAFLGGMVPALLWLWFWLKQEEKRKEPSTMITAVFILGMLAVIVTIPIQKYLHTLMTSSEAEIVLWAAAEELLKLLAVMVLLYRNKEIDQPIDWAIYLGSDLRHLKMHFS